MTRRFKRKIMREIIVDTKKYRYLLDEDIGNSRPRIKKIPLKYVGTTGFLDDTNWKIVKEGGLT